MRPPFLSPLRRFARRFARAERGVTAVEFALVSVPLLMLVFGILELGLVMLVTTTLDAATQSASREIRTGRFQTSLTQPDVTAGGFKSLVCGRMTWLSSQCATQLVVEVQTFANFNGLANAPPPPAANFDPAHPTPPCFSPGQPGDIVLVRAYYDWKLFTPLLDDALDNTGAGARRLLSTTAFRNEPYNSNPPQGAKCT